MSIPVELPDLAATLARYRYAYLMTTSDAAAPHAVAVNVVLQGGELVIESAHAGRITPACRVAGSGRASGRRLRLHVRLRAASDRRLSIAAMAGATSE